MNAFAKNNQELITLINEWEPKLLALSDEIITSRDKEPVAVGVHRY